MLWINTNKQTMSEDICNNKLIIKTQEYITNDPIDDVRRDANNNYLNKNNNNYLTRLRNNLDENLEEISKINVEFKYILNKFYICIKHL